MKVDDQILEVNNETFRGKTNVEAMEILRVSMQKNEPVPGHIQLIVARKKGTTDPAHAPISQGREVKVSMNDTNDLEAKLRTISDSSDLSYPNTPTSPVFKEINGVESVGSTPAKNSVQPHGKLKNPALDRIAGGNAFRNTSYQVATHESIMGDMTIGDPSILGSPSRTMFPPSSVSSPTLNAKQPETVLIQGDTYQMQMVYILYAYIMINILSIFSPEKIRVLFSF